MSGGSLGAPTEHVLLVSLGGGAQVGPWPDGQMWGAAFQGWCAFLAELCVVSEPQGNLDREPHWAHL